MRIYIFFRLMAIMALITYVILRNNSYPDWILELFLFNFVALLSIFSLKLSRIPDDQLARIGVATALGFWTVGSLISSLDTYFRIPIEFNLDLVSEICYVLFIQQPYLVLRGQYETK